MKPLKRLQDIMGENFIKHMNEKAASIGMTHSRFADPSVHQKTIFPQLKTYLCWQSTFTIIGASSSISHREKLK